MLEARMSEPEKLVGITTMARAMLEEARSAPCDSAGCELLKRIHHRVITKLSDVVSADLYEELLTLSVHFDDVSPTPSEVHVAQAELVGWLEGLMAGMKIRSASKRCTHTPIWRCASSESASETNVSRSPI